MGRKIRPTRRAPSGMPCHRSSPPLPARARRARPQSLTTVASAQRLSCRMLPLRASRFSPTPPITSNGANGNAAASACPSAQISRLTPSPKDNSQRPRHRFAPSRLFVVTRISMARSRKTRPWSSMAEQSQNRPIISMVLRWTRACLDRVPAERGVDGAAWYRSTCSLSRS
jgi:hypothetical protein